jgi:hypothetical protein
MRDAIIYLKTKETYLETGGGGMLAISHSLGSMDESFVDIARYRWPM